MKEYELLDHTADAKFRAYGKTRDEAFANAMKGMTAIITDPDGLGQDVQHEIKLKTDDIKKLLFDFLDQILYLMDTEHFVPAKAEVKITGEYELQATVYGDDVRKVGGNLKAVTYSEMVCEENDGTWVLQVVVDI